MRLISFISSSTRRFLKDESGNVLMLFGLSVLFLIGIGGAATDLGRQQLTSVRLQQAADAAAISAGSLSHPNNQPMNDEETTRVANRYFALNYPDINGSTPTASVAIDHGARTITVNSSREQFATAFVNNLGADHLSAQEDSTVASFEGESTSYDILLSMDVSYSMVCGTTELTSPTCNDRLLNDQSANGFPNDGPRLQALRETARIMSESVLSQPNNRMAANSWDHMLRGTQAFTDNASVITDLVWSYRMVDGNGQTDVCRLTDSRLGMRQALDMYPQFRDGVVKAVVLLTDGRNRGIKPNTACEGENMPQWNDETVALCRELKARGVLVYTVAFGRDVLESQDVHNFLSQCASGVAGSNTGQFFFVAPDEDALRSTFESIVASARKFRIIR